MAQLHALASWRDRDRRGRTAVPRTITIDGEPVRLFVDRLTVAELDAVSACDYPRGSSAIDVDRQDAGQLARIEMIDRHLQAMPGEVLLDGGPAECLGSLFGARAGIVGLLYGALLDAQSPSGAEREALSVALRFSAYVDDARRKGLSSDWAKTGTECSTCHALQLCAKRHCDGSVGKAVVWHDRKHVLKTCPVLSFTPETTRILRLFDWTHELTIEHGLPRYRRIALPTGVSLRDEEAWTIAALDVVRQVSTEMLIESITKGRHAAE